MPLLKVINSSKKIKSLQIAMIFYFIGLFTFPMKIGKSLLS